MSDPMKRHHYDIPFKGHPALNGAIFALTIIPLIFGLMLLLVLWLRS
jgi:hypothetical protein